MNGIVTKQYNPNIWLPVTQICIFIDYLTFPAHSFPSCAGRRNLPSPSLADVFDGWPLKYYSQGVVTQRLLVTQLCIIDCKNKDMPNSSLHLLWAAVVSTGKLVGECLFGGDKSTEWKTKYSKETRLGDINCACTILILLLSEILLTILVLFL